MLNSDATHHWSAGRSSRQGLNRWLAVIAATWIISPARPALAADAAASDTTDPVLGLLVEKGMITEEEAAKAQAQADARRTNMAAQFPASVWKISPAIKSVELYGDIRLRYEDRSEKDPVGGRIDLQRERYALRVGLRG